MNVIVTKKKKQQKKKQTNKKHSTSLYELFIRAIRLFQGSGRKLFIIRFAEKSMSQFTEQFFF